MNQHTVIKICGIGDARVLRATIDMGADMVGFVHFAKSPRHVGFERIGQLIETARGRIQTVVLLVNPDDALVEKIIACAPDFIQLHGTETPLRVDEIRLRGTTEIVKALPVGGPADLLALKDYSGHADRLLLDAKPPKGADRPGGLGTRFDWSLLKGLDPNVEYMLSGGLSPDNVADAIKQVSPFGVDVSSGVERAPGEKSLDLIRDFIASARGANQTGKPGKPR